MQNGVELFCMKQIKTVDFSKLKEYFKNKSVRLVYLMGSQASGQTKPYSDIDMAVLFDQNLSAKQRFNARIELISDLAKFLGTDNIDLIDLQGSSPIFAYEAIRHRKELYVKDEDSRVIFETKALSSYFDQKYYLGRHTLLGLGKLKEEYGIRS